MPLVLFAPHSVDLINGEPKIRRNDFDAFLFLVENSYLALLKQYLSVLKNRNNLLRALKEGFSSRSELDFWTEKIIDLSTQISKIRLNLYK